MNYFRLLVVSILTFLRWTQKRSLAVDKYIVAIERDEATTQLNRIKAIPKRRDNGLRKT